MKARTILYVLWGVFWVAGSILIYLAFRTPEIGLYGFKLLWAGYVCFFTGILPLVLALCLHPPPHHNKSHRDHTH